MKSERFEQYAQRQMFRTFRALGPGTSILMSSHTCDSVSQRLPTCSAAQHDDIVSEYL